MPGLMLTERHSTRSTLHNSFRLVSNHFRRFNMSCPSKKCEDLEAKFKALDKDGNKSLSKAELKAGLSVLGLSENQLDSFYLAADKDKDGKISSSEFVRYFQQKK
ncbi:calcium-binding protein E63-1-like [Petromyzon marinus]|uniref:Calmodulin-like isoform X1 n=1 Tax=Petromyzon marinus TaxID=7757 RepID=A0AAJ7UM45_PETMA|nr:calmodulin-like isoform X1 [Petromyzon marinus]